MVHWALGLEPPGDSGDKNPSFSFGGAAGDLQKTKYDEALQSIVELSS